MKTVMNERKVAGAIKALVDEKGLSRVCERSRKSVGSDSDVWKEKESSRIRAVEMDNLRVMVLVRSDRMRNERVRAGWCY